MITHKDIEKMKKVFATKEDLLQMENRFDQKFATKQDVERIEKRLESHEKSNKDSFMETNKRTDKVVEQLIEYIKASHEALAVRLENKIDSMRQEIGGILTNHELRLRKLENDNYS